MDPGIAGTLAAAVWCLHRFHRLDLEQVARRGRAARLRALAVSWSATGVVVGGTAACVTAAAAFGGAMTRAVSTDSAAAILYLAACALALALLLVVEGLTFAFRLRLAREAARKHARRMSVRTLMRTAPNSQSPV